jgi:cytochrome c-type biogenesis protein CcmH
MMRFTMLFFLFTLAVIFLSAGIVAAQEELPATPSDDEVNAVAKQLYCPVCENVPLDVCPTQACAQWRDLIRQQLAQGWSEGEIKTYFLERYGDRVLAIPPARGLNWLLYIIPPVTIIGGSFVLFRTMKAWKRPIDQKSTTVELPPDEYVARLEEELRKR